MKFRPYLLLAELTYRCPLHCPYCSNPVSYPEGTELTTAEWDRVMREAAEMGVLHIGLSGGEPLARTDLTELVKSARAAGLYTNLITSGIGLTPARAAELKDAGLDTAQVSFQADEPSLGDSIAGTRAHVRKLEVAETIRNQRIPLSVNVVLHRRNIDRLREIITLAEKVGAVRLELANTQYYGWGYLNRKQLMPTRRQVDEAVKIALEEKKRLAGRMDVFYIIPDYFGQRPKPCMNGWGQRYLTVNPVGQVLPCPTSSCIKDLRFDNIRQHSLSWIWLESESFNRFRGTEWMPELCRECPQHTVDFGGCRCQAAMLTGDANATDPVCGLSPDRALIDHAIAEAASEELAAVFVPRGNPAGGPPTAP